MINFIQFALYNFAIFLTMLFSVSVNVEVIAPEEAEPGSTFLVEIKISKDIDSGFARYAQELPPGFTATSKYSHDGGFTFKEQKIKIIWYKIPSENSFTISYMVQVDPTAEGILELGGTFSFIENNEVKSYTVPVKKVIIKSAGQQIVNNQNNQNNPPDSVGLNSLSDPQKTLCFRQVVKDGNDYIVNILVKKGEIGQDKFAKVQEAVPQGFNAQYIETQGSIFSFKENNVKMLWMSLPADQQFIVKYRLSPETPGSDPVLTGTFSYIINETTKEIPIANVDFLDSPLLADVVIKSNNNPDNNNNNNNNQNNNPDNNNQNNNNQNNNQNNNTDNNNQNNNNQNNNQNNNVTDNNNNNNNNQNQDITPETGIYYKVQIAAAREVQVNPKYYFRQFNVTEKVQLEMHEGWRKYTIGKFSAYKEARDHRVFIWQNTPIKDAFVAAYNNGTRITVQEALMIANQKWVQ